MSVPGAGLVMLGKQEKARPDRKSMVFEALTIGLRILQCPCISGDINGPCALDRKPAKTLSGSEHVTYAHNMLVLAPTPQKKSNKRRYPYKNP